MIFLFIFDIPEKKRLFPFTTEESVVCGYNLKRLDMFDSLQLKPTVLIIEDEKTQRHLLHNQVEQLGFHVLTAENGRAGIETWSNTPGIRIIITDLMMPEMDGFEVVKHIREHEEHGYTYIMILTIADDTQSLLTGLSLGADEFVKKPILKEELDLRLRGAMRLLRLEDHDVLVFALAQIAATRGGETVTHLQRTKKYCYLLAEDLAKHHPELGLTNQIVHDIANISVLHDIGKINMPTSLLNKKGKYREKERKAQNHTILGGEVLKKLQEKTGSVFLRMGYDIAIAHHERWDGSGYPAGLKGLDIPLPARIMAFADVYDALLSRRSYKDAYSLDHAEQILLSLKERQFDPLVVDSYQRTREQFIAIHEAYPEEEKPW